MKSRRVPLITLVAISMLGIWLGSTQLLFPWQELSPFTKVRTTGNTARVEYQGAEYQLLAINGIPTEELLVHCRKEYGGRWSKRFAEDLVRVLAGFEKKPILSRRVSLKLLDSSGQTLLVPSAPMTAGNRQKVWDARHSASAPSAQLVKAFHAELKSQWSYYETPVPGASSPPDFAAAFTNLESSVTNYSRSELRFELHKIIALGIDGHAGVELDFPRGFTPFLVRAVKTNDRWRYIAFHPDRNGLLDPEHPFLESIDDLPIEDWLAAADAIIPKGSPQYRRHHRMRHLRRLRWLRQELGRPDGPTLVVSLASENGAVTKQTLSVTDKYPIYGSWPAKSSAQLPGNIGYLRLARMDRKAVSEIQEWMPRFRKAKGLIVDVRGNGGGSREALIRLNSFLMAPSDAPRIVNVAHYRLHPAFDENHLAARFMYPAAWSGWTAKERGAIESFRRNFSPVWQSPTNKFSEPHYLVLRHRKQPGVFHFHRPVVVLMDERCFSATDIFLAGLKGLSNVTLVGTPSGGGSARSMEVELEELGADARVGSMISYRTDGRLFDGSGVSPDIEIQPTPGYYIGREDPALRRAIDLLLFEQTENRR